LTDVSVPRLVAIAIATRAASVNTTAVTMAFDESRARRAKTCESSFGMPESILSGMKVD